MSDSNMLINKVGRVETDAELTNHRDVSTRAESLRVQPPWIPKRSFKLTTMNRILLKFTNLSARLGNSTKVVDDISFGHTDTSIADVKGRQQWHHKLMLLLLLCEYVAPPFVIQHVQPTIKPKLSLHQPLTPFSQRQHRHPLKWQLGLWQISPLTLLDLLVIYDRLASRCTTSTSLWCCKCRCQYRCRVEVKQYQMLCICHTLPNTVCLSYGHFCDRLSPLQLLWMWRRKISLFK